MATSSVLSVESVEELQGAVALLRSVGLTDDNIAVKTLIDKIERGKSLQRAWLAKVEEIPATLNAKIRRVRSTADADSGYDYGKLLYELPTLVAMLEGVIQSAGEFNVR